MTNSSSSFSVRRGAAALFGDASWNGSVKAVAFASDACGGAHVTHAGRKGAVELRASSPQRRLARWTSFFVAWAAVGCVDYTVELVSPHQKGRPEFEVERCIARDEPLHYNEITVTWEEGSEVVFYWRAKVDGVPESSPAHFTYGEAPPHFENREFRPLDRNRRYVVAVGGPGHMGGTLEIEVDAQGLVHED